MGNLIKDFWTYQGYYGITEVVGGSLDFRKAEGKYETRIEKALEYLLEPGRKLLSHMSMQTYNDYLNKTGRSLRDETDRAYYPMFIEFETKKLKADSFKVDWKHKKMAFDVQYNKMVEEAFLLVTYLIHEKNIEEKDILILLNNSRSVYVMLNPVTYKLMPARNLHEVYSEMYKIMSQEVSLEYADIHMYKSSGLMKTPNTWYKGGYFVPITYHELRNLKNNPKLKKELTKAKRSLNYDVPGVFSSAIVELYETAKENIKGKTMKSMSSSCTLPINKEPSIHEAGENKNKEFNPNKNTSNVVYIHKPDQRNCINYIQENEIADGMKNFALVSVAYHYKGLGYSLEQTYEVLQQIADEWNYETPNRIQSKVKSVYRSKKKFTCDKARDNLGLEDCTCSNCPFNPYKKAEKRVYTQFSIQKDIVEALWNNKASLRHYKAFLQLSRERLFNRWFVPETEGIQLRTIKELCKLSGSNFIFSKNGESVLVYNKVQVKGQFRIIPNEFWDKGIYNQFGEQLKHYLKLLFCGYKTSKDGNYIQTRVGIERIRDILGYKDSNGVYKLIKRLKDMGFVVYNKGKLFAIYLRSYKIIDINDRRKRKNKGHIVTDLQRVEGLAAGESVMINKYTDDRGSPDTG